jgi:hypothetical protein
MKKKTPFFIPSNIPNPILKSETVKEFPLGPSISQILFFDVFLKTFFKDLYVGEIKSLLRPSHPIYQRHLD